MGIYSEMDVISHEQDRVDQTDIYDDGDEGANEEEALCPSEKRTENDDARRSEHEAAEARREAEWNAMKAEKEAALQKALHELVAMSDEDVTNKSVKRIGEDLERLTRRNMKMCVAEVIQTKVLDDPDFARMVSRPGKNLMNCFKHINKKAEEYIRRELEMNGVIASGVFGEDVPDDLCYLWAVEYYNDPDVEVDKEKDIKFTRKPYIGSVASKTKQKSLPKGKTGEDTKTVTLASASINNQPNLFGGSIA